MLHITSLFAAILGLLMIFLALQVVKFRRTKSVGVGDNGDQQGQLAIRAHANFVEYVPMALILMAIYELNGGISIILYIIGSVLVLARVLHFLGLSKSAGKTFGRFYGTLLTWIIVIVLAILNIYQWFTHINI